MTELHLPTPPSVSNPVMGHVKPRIPVQNPVGGPSRYDAEVASLPDLPKPQLAKPFQTVMPNNGRRAVNAFGVRNEYGEIGPLQISRRALLPTDVEVDIHYCGLCHSDIHQAYNEWKSAIYPQVEGHEIVGIVLNVGPLVTEFKVGDKVAVGTMVNSCRVCKSCESGNEQYCTNGGPSWTYNSHERFPGELLPMGEMTAGGYSDMIVVNKDFVFKLPDNLTFDQMASISPLLCAGVTVFTPLMQDRVGPGRRVGVAGIGGLGHLAIKMIKALGATAVVITRSPWKMKDASRLGADYAILASDDSQMKKAQGTLDLILCTIPSPHDMCNYLNLLALGGKMWNLGVEEPHQPPNMKLLNRMNRSICASEVGGLAATRAMLQFCMDKNITADVEIVKFDKAREHFDRVRAADVRYRFVFDVKGNH